MKITKIQENMRKIDEEVTIQKPYPNEHSCRIHDPKDLGKPWGRNVTTIDGKQVDRIYGDKHGHPVLQSYRYNTSIWSPLSARAHCRSVGGYFEPAVTKVENEGWVCECLNCGYKIKTTEHCNTLKCPQCKGEMRRAERPGIGKLYLDEFRKTGTDENIRNMPYSYEQLIDGHHCLHISYCKLKAGEKFENWTEQDIVKYHAAIVSVLREHWFPMFPSKV